MLLVDDHEMFAESMAKLLAEEQDIAIVGMAGTLKHALHAVEDEEPDVVLLDYRLPDVDGPEGARRILDRFPDVKVVMLTGFAEDVALVEAIKAGCSGFITKDRAASEVVEAVRAAAQGEALISPEMLSRLLPRFRDDPGQALGSDLTDREHEVLGLISEGLSNKQIAERLVLSVHTVRNHVQNVISKLGAHSKLEALSIAVREGIVEIRGD